MIVEANCPHCDKREMFVVDELPGNSISLPWKAKSVSGCDIATCRSCYRQVTIKRKWEVKP